MMPAGKEQTTVVDERVSEEYERDVEDWMRHATGEFEGMAAAVQRATAAKEQRKGLRAWLARMLTPEGPNGS